MSGDAISPTHRTKGWRPLSTTCEGASQHQSAARLSKRGKPDGGDEQVVEPSATLCSREASRQRDNRKQFRKSPILSVRRRYECCLVALSFSFVLPLYYSPFSHEEIGREVNYGSSGSSSSSSTSSSATTTTTATATVLATTTITYYNI